MKINQRAYFSIFLENLLNVLITVLKKQIFFMNKDNAKILKSFWNYYNIIIYFGNNYV